MSALLILPYRLYGKKMEHVAHHLPLSNNQNVVNSFLIPNPHFRLTNFLKLFSESQGKNYRRGNPTEFLKNQ